MTRVVVDASALAAIAFGEPEGRALAARLDGAAVFAPTLLQFELASVAWKKARREPANAPALIAALDAALAGDYGIMWRSVEPADVALVALAVGCTAYDAAYLWLAGTLGADLVTLDARLSRASAALA
jgi:predicted nucleic acid-binding protein